MDSPQVQRSKAATRRLLAERGPHVEAVLESEPETAAALRAMCAQHGWSESDLTFWLMAPTTRLDGAMPVDRIASEPDQVVAAAEMSMTTEW